VISSNAISTFRRKLGVDGGGGGGDGGDRNSQEMHFFSKLMFIIKSPLIALTLVHSPIFIDKEREVIDFSLYMKRA
jgi:hypothetical protein